MGLLAAGTVNGVYPRPVVADTLSAVNEFIDNELPSHADKFGLSVSVFITNTFTEDGTYVNASVNGLDENEFSTTVGKMSESSVKNGYNMVGIASYSYRPVFEVEANSFNELVEKLNKLDAKGTLNISFKFYPNGYRAYAESIKYFKVIL